jgi:hypothetical protein
MVGSVFPDALKVSILFVVNGTGTGGIISTWFTCILVHFYWQVLPPPFPKKKEAFLFLSLGIITTMPGFAPDTNGIWNVSILSSQLDGFTMNLVPNVD